MTGYCIACNESTKTRFRSRTHISQLLSHVVVHGLLPMNEEITEFEFYLGCLPRDKEILRILSLSTTPPPSPSKKKIK